MKKTTVYIIIELAIIAYMLCSLIFSLYKPLGLMLLLVIIALFVLFRIGWLMYEHPANTTREKDGTK